ncbi:unnamed protein product, partial [Prorocentrum cordatum]
MEDKNTTPSGTGHSELIVEEAMAATLYTGPMYEKYNLVFRAKTGAPCLKERLDHISTLHGISSFIVNMSKITSASTLWRGSTKVHLPESLTKKDKWNLRGGIEFGITSMTQDRAQAVHYAEGAASTAFQARQGLVDRGAEMKWISQYPHEAEILFSPLLGLEMIGTSVDHGAALVELRLGLNLTAETLDQITSKRHALMKDAATNGELEILAAARDQRSLGNFAALASAAWKGYPLKHDAQWYNNDGHILDCIKELTTIKQEAQKLADLRGEKLMQALGAFTAGRPARRESTSKLDLGGREDVEKLPEDLFGLTQLQTLDLRYCPALQALPESLGQLSALQTLDLGFCQALQALPESLGQLVDANAGRDRMSGPACPAREPGPALGAADAGPRRTRPESLGQFSALQPLDLSECAALQALPEDLGQLSALQKLYLSYCWALQALPESLGQLSALQTLDLRYCPALQALPESPSQLSALQTLDLRSCQALHALPESLGQLSALQMLALPENLGQFSALQWLGLGGCQALQALLESLGQLSALQTLCLDECVALQALPESLGQLSALQKLYLSECVAPQALPESLSQHSALRVL